MNKDTTDFIRKHADADVRQLALQGNRNPDVDLTYALEQIAGRQKARLKLPSWADIDGIVYPPHISMEQCSSEQTASYKAEIVTKGSGTVVTSATSHQCQSLCKNRFVDLTGGFGVDFSFIARHFNHAVYVERQAHLCAISSENFKLMSLNAEVINADGMEYLHHMDHVDLIFIDPARRDDYGGRTYGIADCTPNVLEVMDELMQKTDVLMLKLSPMLDWRKAIADIHHPSPTTYHPYSVSEVHIVSVDNECKELLIIIRHDAQPIKVVCVNLLSNGSRERFEVCEDFTRRQHIITTCHPSAITCLFEPNASIMKAGCFNEIPARFPVVQLDNNSHLFVSDQDISDFPGRRFEIMRRTSMNKRELKEALAGIDKANIAVRNFPISVADLRKKLKLKDGGDVFIFATTVAKEGHQLFICRKIG